MAEKSALEKMRLASGMSAALLHMPNELQGELAVPDDVTVADASVGTDFILDFATSQAQAEERLRALKPDIGASTIAWLAYPKGSKAAGYDRSRDTVFAFAKTIGLVLVANISVDDTWSALRVRPLA